MLRNAASGGQAQPLSRVFVPDSFSPIPKADRPAPGRTVRTIGALPPLLVREERTNSPCKLNIERGSRRRASYAGVFCLAKPELNPSYVKRNICAKWLYLLNKLLFIGLY
jgi:hypothetical protein